MRPRPKLPDHIRRLDGWVYARLDECGTPVEAICVGKWSVSDLEDIAKDLLYNNGTAEPCQKRRKRK